MTCTLPTPYGKMELVTSEVGICTLRPSIDATGTPPASPLAKEAACQLAAYFEGHLEHFDLPLDWAGATDFRKRVWEALLQIPYGTTSTYSELAEQLGNPLTVRAVGTANGANPIAIIVPCHRIIGKGGSLTGYAHGLAMKRSLLELEGALSQGLFG